MSSRLTNTYIATCRLYQCTSVDTRLLYPVAAAVAALCSDDAANSASFISAGGVELIVQHLRQLHSMPASDEKTPKAQQVCACFLSVWVIYSTVRACAHLHADPVI